MSVTRKTMLAVSGLAFALVLGTGCVATTGVSDSPTHGNNTAAPKAADTPKPKPSDTPPSDVIGKFGMTYHYGNGVSVRVGKPHTYVPSEYAVGGGRPFDIAFWITIVNGSSKILDPSETYYTMQSGNVDADEVYDSPRLEGTPMTKLLPGREAKFQVGFNVKDPNDLVFEISPGFDYNSALYQK